MSAKVIEIGKRRVGSYEKIDSGLFRHRATGIYYVRKSFKHLRIPELFESLRTDKITAARREIQRKIEAHKERYLGGKTVTDRDDRVGKTIGSIIDEMFLTVTPKRRSGTQNNHRIYFTELAEHWGSIDVNRLTLVMWERWLADFKRSKNRKTFDDYVKWMNTVLNYAYEHRYLHHPLSLPSTDGLRKEIGRVYTDEELKALWNAMSEDTRDQFVLAFECFLRLREALYLTWDRIDLKTGKLTLRAEDVKTGSKTGKGRTIFVSPNALTRLRARRERLEAESPYVFPSPENPERAQHQNKTAWANAKKAAKIKGRARWHDIRHTSLTKALLEQNLNAVAVSEYAGVSLRTIQRVYLHATEERTKGVSSALSIERLSIESGGVKKA